MRESGINDKNLKIVFLRWESFLLVSLSCYHTCNFQQHVAARDLKFITSNKLWLKITSP